ncbi:MAG: DUF3298 domain-containing protein [Candidatus Pacebacteria bacterium]|nr:DUF3298 domain-containing protein [Candidatus Paceibacterota bacterium]
MKILIGLVALIAIGIIGFWGWGTNSIVPQTTSLNEDEMYYTIMVEEPATTLLTSESADTKARQTMHDALVAVVAQFKNDSGLESLTPEDIEIQGLGEDRKYALGGEYDEYQGKSTVSYVYRIYMDTLGAHPNHFYHTFTFDEAGNELMLQDIFAAGAPYLTRLSEEAYKKVVEELTVRANGEVYPEMEDTVRMGTAPSPEALQFFYLTETDLHLLFPPYQVAAYAAGSFDIAIPLSELGDVLKAEYQ